MHLEGTASPPRPMRMRWHWCWLGVLVVAMATASYCNRRDDWPAAEVWARGVHDAWREALPPGWSGVPTEPGQVVDSASRAWTLLQSMPAARDEVEAWRSADAPRSAPPAALLATLAPVRELLLEAARQATVGSAPGTPVHSQIGAAHVVECLPLHAVLLAEFVAHRDAAPARALVAAVADLRLSAALATSCLGIESLVASVWLSQLLGELDDAFLTRWSPTDLATIAAELAAVDHFVPTELWWSQRMTAEGIVLLGSQPRVFRFSWGAWAHGFDATAAERGVLVELATRLGPPVPKFRAGERPWSEVEAELAALDAEVRSNLRSRAVLGNLRDAEHESRQARARLRLLRLAVAFHQGAAQPELIDPLGRGLLQATISGDTATFRCADAAVPPRTATRAR